MIENDSSHFGGEVIAGPSGNGYSSDVSYRNSQETLSFASDSQLLYYLVAKDMNASSHFGEISSSTINVGQIVQLSFGGSEAT